MSGMYTLSGETEELESTIKTKINPLKKETDMTTTTPPLPPQTSIDVLKKDKATLLKRSGIDEFGFYVEVIRWRKTSVPGRYKFERQEKFFLARNITVSYRRKAGNKSARWRTMKWDDHATAVQKFKRMIRDAETVSSMFAMTMRGEPMAIQLTEADVIAITDGEAPYARFVGGLHNDRIMGKLDDNKEMELEVAI